MPTLSVELPESVYRRVIALTKQEQERIANVAFSVATDSPIETPGDSEAVWLTPEELNALDIPLTEEDLAAIGRGVADADAGRSEPGWEALARLRGEMGWTK